MKITHLCQGTKFTRLWVLCPAAGSPHTRGHHPGPGSLPHPASSLRKHFPNSKPLPQGLALVFPRNLTSTFSLRTLQKTIGKNPLSEKRERSLPDKDKYEMRSLIGGLKKHNTDELLYKIEIDPQTWKTSLRLPKGRGGGDKLGI